MRDTARRRVQGLRLLRWAPDGSRLLVVSEVDGRGVINLVPADGADGAMSETLDLGMTVDWATWHPDGTSLLVKGIGADGVPQLYSVSLEGTRTPEAMLRWIPRPPCIAHGVSPNSCGIRRTHPTDGRITYSTVVDLLPGQAPGHRTLACAWSMPTVLTTGCSSSPLIPHTRSRRAGPRRDACGDRVQQGEAPVLAIAAIEDPTRATIVGPDATIGTGVIWSPDGTQLLTWGADGNAALVDAATGMLTPLERKIPLEAAWQPVP